jgi:two-component system, NarL family, sensor kinase
VRMGACPYPPGDPGADDVVVIQGSAHDRGERRTGWPTAAAAGLGLLALAEAALAVVAGLRSGLGWARLVDLFVVTNTAIGLSLALAGWLIAHHRPRNAVGWSLLAGGCCWTLTATGIAVLAWAGGPELEGTSWRLVATVTNAAWPWGLTVFLPLALLLFPDGRLPGPRWRVLVPVLVFGGAWLTAMAVLDPTGGLTAAVGVRGYPDSEALPELSWVGAVMQVAVLLGWAGALAALVVRYRRGYEPVRRQVLWLLLAVVVVFTAFLVDAVLGLESVVVGVLPILLIPLAIAVAVLRHDVVDVRLLVSRSLLVLSLAVSVAAAYLVLRVALEAALGEELSLGPALLATLLVAVAFNPVRTRLQRWLDHAFYGARHDPVRAVAAVGGRLEGGVPSSGPGLTGALEALCQVMRFPAATILVDGVPVAAVGDLPPARRVIPLRAGDAQVGELVVGLRTGERRMAAADLDVVRLLAAPLAVAVEAQRLADELRISRERIIGGREEERRRLRRDLHDGLGPVLTSVVLNAEASLHLLRSNPDRSAELLVELRDRTVGAVEEIRRLVYDLRPAALDGLGLVGALRAYAAVASRRVDGGPLTVHVSAPDSMPELPAAIEVAAYRIATEALTNVVKHSSAVTAEVRLALEEPGLVLEVSDDGLGAGPAAEQGTGLASIRERVAEVGGTCRIDFDRTGAQVRAELPLPGSSVTEPTRGTVTRSGSDG